MNVAMGTADSNLIRGEGAGPIHRGGGDKIWIGWNDMTLARGYTWGVFTPRGERRGEGGGGQEGVRMLRGDIEWICSSALSVHSWAAGGERGRCLATEDIAHSLFPLSQH